MLRTGNLGLDLSKKNKKKKKPNQKNKTKQKQTNKKLRIKGPTRTFPTTSKRFQIKITDKQTARLPTIQQRYIFFILFTLAVLSETNLRPVPGD